MFEYKLQIGCLIVISYFIINYIKGSLDKNVNFTPGFDALLYISPWAIILDGLTAWTVNHQDVVPEIVNRLLHLVFIVSMECIVSIIFIYMLYQVFGKQQKWVIVLECLPGIISTLITIICIKDLYYVNGSTTNYSMGISVIVCYISLVIQFSILFVIVCIKFRTLEKRKSIGIISFIAICIMILIVQIVKPESLVSCLLPTIAIAGMYTHFEDPAEKRLNQYNDNMVRSFATLVESRDDNTGGHIRRTQGYVKIILDEMSKCKRYKNLLTKDYVSNVIKAAPMHDIGKIGVPDQILQKPAKLTAEEFEIMKLHSSKGGEIIKETFDELDEPDYQQIAYEVARYHHEKWNGKGYPEGLREKKIPLHARIMAIADVFDAVSAKRVYRDAMPVDKCFKIIEEGVGKDFDPTLAELFLGARKDVLAYMKADKAKCDEKALEKKRGKSK